MQRCIGKPRFESCKGDRIKLRDQPLCYSRLAEVYAGKTESCFEGASVERPDDLTD